MLCQENRERETDVRAVRSGGVTEEVDGLDMEIERDRSQGY